MARWNEEQERWSGGRYGEEERRGEWRSEHGGEGGWRGRDWRDEDRGGSWRPEERRDDWGWRGERGTGERGPMERWSSERERDREREGGFGEREGWSEREGRRRHGGGEYGREYGRGEYGRESGRGGLGERGTSPEAGYGLMEGPSFGAGGMYGGAGGMYGGAPGSGETYGWRGRSGEGSSRGAYGGSSERWSEDDRGTRYGRGEPQRFRGYGEEDDQGPLERVGEKVKEGFRKLTGRGPKGYKRSDERIREDVSERIARSGVNAEEVEVRVEKGEVTLTGFVESREDKRRLEDLADDVFGVEEVHNHLRLRREPAQPAAAIGQGQQTTATQGTTQGATGQPPGQRPQQGTPQPGRH